MSVCGIQIVDSSTSPYRIRVEFVPLDGNVYINEPNGNIATATALPLDKTEA